ncbi:NAD(P)H-dependent flavin oxidoreductase [Sphingomonas sp. MMS24-J13]|uniref:NAD(P)H-dependent flavin oxidoreductase n=1 Tax=Sphingomonas sp. MMS24-J13 TaxID=3238686 RepID=UPI00384E55E9
MAGWRSRRLIERFGITTPIVQAPMAAAGGEALAIAAMRGGALGSLPCASISPDQVRAQVAAVRIAVSGPINLNFFCHVMPDAVDDAAWRAALQPYYDEYRVGPPAVPPVARRPFDDFYCAAVEDTKPEVVSFHFGLPPEPLLDRVRATGALILSSATSPAEARWLAERGVDAVIAQGWEAGGHAARFLPADPASHMGTIALVPQIVDAIDRPVIAAGGIADGRGVAAALLLGAGAVQIGTAYLACPESLIGPVHRQLLTGEAAEETVFTNVFTGRLARGFVTRLVRERGPISPVAPPFPHAGDALAELRKADPAAFANMWAGQAARLAHAEGAEALTRRLAADALALLDGGSAPA